MFSISEQYSFSFPTDIRFGRGTQNATAHELKARKLSRPLIVTDRGLSESSIVVGLKNILSAQGLSPVVFSDFSGNPVASHVTSGVGAFIAHRADSIVGVGGGAALDVAKAIALMSCHDGSILDYCDEKPITNPLPFWVALPTTSGTGSEVGRSTVISDENTHEKKVVFHPSMLAKLVILDPDLTLDMPASITAATGMDALSHLVESYLAKDFHPVCDALSLHGLSILKNNLEPCFRVAGKTDRSDKDLQSRGMMMLAAMMGAVAFQKGLGVTHSCAHALSSVCNTHHGLANGVMLPFTMAFNAKRVPDRFAPIAKALELDRHDGHAVVEWMRDLQKQIDIPTNLSKIGVLPEHLGDLVSFAIKDGCHLNNPVPVTRSDFIEIFQAAL